MQSRTANCAQCVFDVSGHPNGVFARGQVESLTFNLARAQFFDRTQIDKNKGIILPLVEALRKATSGSYDSSVFKNIDHKVLRLLLNNTHAFQLAEGCSIGCDFCGVGAKNAVGQQIEAHDLLRLAVQFTDELGKQRPFLYYASDPLDYATIDPISGAKIDYAQLHKAWTAVLGHEPFVSSSIPRGAEGLALEGVEQGWLNRISIHYKNIARLRQNLPQFLDENAREKQYPEVEFYDTRIDLRLSKLTRNRISSKLGISSSRRGGIGCFDGVLVTPSGFSNIVQGVITPLSHDAQFVVPIDLSKLNDSLPLKRVKIERLLSRTVVQGEWRVLANAKAGIPDALQRLFVLDPDKPFLGNIIAVQNGIGEKGYYKVNFMDGSATRCREADYKFTRTRIVTLLMLLERSLALTYPEVVPGNQAIKEFHSLDIKDASSFLNKELIGREWRRIDNILPLYRFAGGPDPMSLPMSSIGREKWNAVLSMTTTNLMDGYFRPLEHFYSKVFGKTGDTSNA